MDVILSKEIEVRVSKAQPRLVSKGYVFVNENRIFVQIFHIPGSAEYLVKLKIPAHATLHIWWPGAKWRFENEWLMFTIEAGPHPFASHYHDAWEITKKLIVNKLKYISLS